MTAPALQGQGKTGAVTRGYMEKGALSVRKYIQSVWLEKQYFPGELAKISKDLLLGRER